MALVLYDENQVLLTDPLRLFVDGAVGGIQERKFYIRNNNATFYYVNVTVSPEITDGVSWGEFGENGWGFKLCYGERQPTEKEWNLVKSGDTIQLPDIGGPGAPNTNYHPVWVRLMCPSRTIAQIRDDLRIKTSAIKRVV